jgi:hypothetical protein
VIAVLYEIPDGLRHSHGVTSTRPVGLESRIHIPQHAGSALFGFQLCGPLFAKPDFVQPVGRSNGWDKNAEGQNDRRPGLFAEQATRKGIDVFGELEVVAVLAMDDAASGAQACEKIDNVAGGGNFGEGEGHARQGVGVAAGDTDFTEFAGKAIGGNVGLHPHLAIANFVGRDVGGEPGEVVFDAAAGEARENMVDAEEEFTFGEVHKERYKIAATALNFEMITFRDAIDAEMHFGAGGHGDGNFFAEEEVGIFAEGFRSFDGIVVGDGDDGHAQMFAAGIDVSGFVIRLFTKPAQTWRAAHAGAGGVYMKVAAHG